MKDRLLTWALPIVAVLCLCHCSGQKEHNETERYILESERQWAESVATGDTSAIDRILADDFIGVDPEGHLYNKQRMIDETRNAPKYFVSNRLNDVKVRFYVTRLLRREARPGKNVPVSVDVLFAPTPGCSATAGGKSSPPRT